MRMTMMVSLEDTVQVELSESGKEIYRQWLNGKPDDAKILLTEGATTWALWRVMQVFGPHLYFGQKDLPFKSHFFISKGD